MNKIIGRDSEIKQLKNIYQSKDAEFLAIYGRRRVGKTFLIEEFFADSPLFFKLTGQKKASLKTQLANFTKSFNQAFPDELIVESLSSWSKCFDLLERAIDKLNTKKNPVILFFDELPWLASSRSQFLSGLEYFWNTFASKNKAIKLIVCGSAASWMINNIVNSTGGLHNRLTKMIRLMPFNLQETELFLKKRGVKYSRKDIIELYMITGGIPHYLKQISKNHSLMQNINQLCFNKDGFLVDEFNRLYDSLFKNSALYKEIVSKLSANRSGLKQSEIAQKTGLSRGATLLRALNNLEEAGFIMSYIPFANHKKGIFYKLTDEYSFFYLRWIKSIPKAVLNDPGENYWHYQQNSQKWKIWSGYTFENICFKHSGQIKRALGISGIQAIPTVWRLSVQKKLSSQTAQIDLLFDRNDNAITICEIKFWHGLYTLNKNEYNQLKYRLDLFKEQTKTKKNIFLAFITANGIKDNMYFQELVNSVVSLDDLFIY